MKTEKKTYLCKRCNRPIWSEESKARGYGSTCFKKMIAEKQLRIDFELKTNDDE